MKQLWSLFSPLMKHQLHKHGTLNWNVSFRNFATVHTSSNQPSDAVQRSVNMSPKHWNEAACLMIVAPMNNSEPFSLGYLMVERSRTGGVMPGSFVFPGGNVDSTDSHPKWIDMFKDILNIDICQEGFLHNGANKPPIYNQGESIIPKHVSLRITAIRETFEEAGVLLCKPRSADSGAAGQGKLYYEYDRLQDRNEVKAWQKRIRKTSTDFIELCRELDCVPDIHVLYEWNNWLTPTTFKPKSRFDTMFYITILPKMLQVVIDGHEAASAQWASPSSILADHGKGHIRLMPPQIYEFSRLKPIKTIRGLKEKIGMRQKLGIERNFPVLRNAKDGMMFLLPGDDLYPETPDLTGADSSPEDIPKTLAQIKESSTNIHRGVIGKAGTFSLDDINVTRFGHIY